MTMKNLQNLHTHSTFCDGRNTPEEMIAVARSKGFESLGFSGHSYTYYSNSPTPITSLEKTEAYKREIARLKEKHEGEMDLFLGIEFDMYSGTDLSGYDYLIGACHYLKMGDRFIAFDRSAEYVRNVIETEFSGDGMAFAKEYYRQVALLPDYGNFDILAHFDIITKNIEKDRFFDIDSKEYIKAATDAMDALRGKIPFFEVNTGAISRGYRTSPYPTLPLLREFKARGFGAIISSDCHDANYLDCAFDMARELLIKAGFTEKYILTKNGFCAVEL